jgi:hypothetical protein
VFVSNDSIRWLREFGCLKDDPKLYLLDLIHDQYQTTFAVAVEKLNSILAKYPENKVIEAADKVRKAQKSTRDGELLDPRALGIFPREQAGHDITRMRYEAFWDLLDPSKNGKA